MKKYIEWKKVCISVSIISILSFIAAVIPFMQNIAERTFHIGFPFAFLAVRIRENYVFTTHLAVSVLLLDIVLGYLVCCFAERIIKRKGNWVYVTSRLPRMSLILF